MTQGATHTAAAATPGPHLTRPVWLEPEPQRLHEQRLQPLLDGRPLQLLAGPERIETGWWDGGAAGEAGGVGAAGGAGGAPTARDYFVAQASDGSLVWVYRARLPHSDAAAGWFLHGRFA